MDGNTGVCSNDTEMLQICSSQLNLKCPGDLVAQFHMSMKEEIWRVDALLLLNTIFAGVIVGIGAYGHRYRYHSFTRYLFLGVTTLLLSIVSLLLSANSSTHGAFNVAIGGADLEETLIATCGMYTYQRFMVLLCVCLVQIAAINTTAIVAADDREARVISPPFDLLVQGVWTFCLVVSNKTLDRGPFSNTNNNVFLGYTPFAIIYAKMAYKYYAFERARRSFALGRNPRLIVGYMQQLRESESQQTVGGDDVPPPLVVMGEEGGQVEKQPHGYVFNNRDSLVTLDRVWRSDNMLLVSMPHLKDICLSFALFKLLRCRFARYQPTDAMNLSTLRRVLLEDGRHERTLRVIADELSFLHDYYYSSLAVSYSTCWLPVLSVSISCLSIGFCILAGLYVMSESAGDEQIFCDHICTIKRLATNGFNIKSSATDKLNTYSFGSLYFSLVPALLLSAVVVISEARDIASFMCSNWTKVLLTCRCINQACSQQKWVGSLLGYRCGLMKHWNGKMSQCSVLVLQQRRTPLLLLLRRILRLSDQKRKPVKVPDAVKVCIIDTLRSSVSTGGSPISNGTTSLRQSPAGESFLSACNGKGATDTILLWHIATSILEVRHPHRHGEGSHVSDHMVAATHLSRYCAYLVAFCPDLLPDDDAWTKDLYKDVKKAAERALTGGGAIEESTPEVEYRQLVEKLLSAESKYGVINHGASLGKQLVELREGEEMAWKLLAGFWSEMILYITPSDNISGHAEAIARGGELITLLWALLTHVGIVDRPATDTAPDPVTV